eukprot:243365-Amorphochlora_amoeboformis.AAC.1
MKQESRAWQFTLNSLHNPRTPIVIVKNFVTFITGRDATGRCDGPQYHGDTAGTTWQSCS